MCHFLHQQYENKNNRGPPDGTSFQEKLFKKSKAKGSCGLGVGNAWRYLCAHCPSLLVILALQRTPASSWPTLPSTWHLFLPCHSGTGIVSSLRALLGLSHPWCLYPNPGLLNSFSDPGWHSPPKETQKRVQSTSRASQGFIQQWGQGLPPLPAWMLLVSEFSQGSKQKCKTKGHVWLLK